MAEVVWQPSLLGAAAEGKDGAAGEDDGPQVDRAFSGLVRTHLDPTAWFDHVPRWVTRADEVFEALLEQVSWRHQTRRMYDNVVDQPRLTGSWKSSAGVPILPVIGEMREALSERYRRDFDTGGLNLYRDGRDSVAWHGDRIAKEVVDPVVGIVSLGHPRTFRLRPKGGGHSVPIVLENGDLLVTGGTAQRTWEHAILKTASAGPRISITFRHGPVP